MAKFSLAEARSFFSGIDDANAEQRKAADEERRRLAEERAQAQFARQQELQDRADTEYQAAGTTRALKQFTDERALMNATNPDAIAAADQANALAIDTAKAANNVNRQVLTATDTPELTQKIVDSRVQGVTGALDQKTLQLQIESARRDAQQAVPAFGDPALSSLAASRIAVATDEDSMKKIVAEYKYPITFTGDGSFTVGSSTVKLPVSQLSTYIKNPSAGVSMIEDKLIQRGRQAAMDGAKLNPEAKPETALEKLKGEKLQADIKNNEAKVEIARVKAGLPPIGGVPAPTVAARPSSTPVTTVNTGPLGVKPAASPTPAAQAAPTQPQPSPVVTDPYAQSRNAISAAESKVASLKDQIAKASSLIGRKTTTPQAIEQLISARKVAEAEASSAKNAYDAFYQSESRRLGGR